MHSKLALKRLNLFSDAISLVEQFKFDQAILCFSEFLFANKSFCQLVKPGFDDQELIQIYSTALIEMSTCYIKIGNFSKSNRRTLELLEFGQKIRKSEIIVKAYTNLGNIYLEMAERLLPEIELFDIAKQRISALSEIEDKFETNINSSIDYFFKSLEIVEKQQLSVSNVLQLQAFFNLGTAEYVKGRLNNQFTKSISYLNKAIELNPHVSDKSLIGKAFNTLGMICLTQKNYLKALHFFEKDQVICIQDFDLEGEIYTLKNKSLCYEGMHEYEKALGKIEEAKKKFTANKFHLPQNLFEELLERESDLETQHIEFKEYKTQLKSYLSSQRLKQNLGDFLLKSKTIIELAIDKYELTADACLIFNHVNLFLKNIYYDFSASSPGLRYKILLENLPINVSSTFAIASLECKCLCKEKNVNDALQIKKTLEEFLQKNSHCLEQGAIFLMELANYLDDLSEFGNLLETEGLYKTALNYAKRMKSNDLCLKILYNFYLFCKSHKMSNKLDVIQAEIKSYQSFMSPTLMFVPVSPQSPVAETKKIYSKNFCKVQNKKELSLNVNEISEDEDDINTTEEVYSVSRDEHSLTNTIRTQNSHTNSITVSLDLQNKYSDDDVKLKCDLHRYSFILDINTCGSCISGKTIEYLTSPLYNLQFSKLQNINLAESHIKWNESTVNLIKQIVEYNVEGLIFVNLALQKYKNDDLCLLGEWLMCQAKIKKVIFRGNKFTSFRFLDARTNPYLDMLDLSLTDGFKHECVLQLTNSKFFPNLKQLKLNFTSIAEAYSSSKIDEEFVMTDLKVLKLKGCKNLLKNHGLLEKIKFYSIFKKLEVLDLRMIDIFDIQMMAKNICESIYDDEELNLFYRKNGYFFHMKNLKIDQRKNYVAQGEENYIEKLFLMLKTEKN